MSHGGENHHLSLGTEKTLLSTVVLVYTALNADGYAIRLPSALKVQFKDELR